MLEEVFVSLVIIFSISFVAFLWKDVILLTVSLLIVSIFTLRHFHEKNDVFIFLFGGMLGAGAETFCIYFGAWNYTKPTYLIPLWLQILWGLASLVISRITLEIKG